jgi:hypothetical protein
MGRKVWAKNDQSEYEDEDHQPYQSKFTSDEEMEFVAK